MTDAAPRLRLINRAEAAYAMWHPCEVCGTVDAPFGFGVSLLHHQPGRWFCGAHREHGDDASGR